MSIRALVLTGYGINCQDEMALAAELAGACVDIVHAHDWLRSPSLIFQYRWILFPGGFSFGDELGAARALANKIQSQADLRDGLQQFVADGGAILGVCNGFQLLVKLGLLPFSQTHPLKQHVSLAHNSTGRFIDQWTEHTVHSSHCIYTRGMNRVYLPLRHKEGRFMSASTQITQALYDRGQVVLEYTDNPNGSERSIAGICDETGRVLGMMAHPEAAVSAYQLPDWSRRDFTSEEGPGLPLFKNAVKYLTEHPSAHALAAT